MTEGAAKMCASKEALWPHLFPPPRPRPRSDRHRPNDSSEHCPGAQATRTREPCVQGGPQRPNAEIPVKDDKIQLRRRVAEPDEDRSVTDLYGRGRRQWRHQSGWISDEHTLRVPKGCSRNRDGWVAKSGRQERPRLDFDVPVVLCGPPPGV